MRELIKSVSSSKPPNMSSRLIVFRVGARREPALLSTLSLSALHWSIYLKESMPEADTSPEATRDNCRELCAGPFCSCSGCPQAPWVHAAKHLHGYVADANWLKSLFISRSFNCNQILRLLESSFSSLFSVFSEWHSHRLSTWSILVKQIFVLVENISLAESIVLTEFFVSVCFWASDAQTVTLSGCFVSHRGHRLFLFTTS